MKPKILLALVLLGLAVQFIRPAKNLGVSEGPDFIGAKHPVPAEVRTVLARSCYDCHSDRTNYPWYAEIQPVGWWLAYHVNDARKHLNFSAFARYEPKRAEHKLEELVEKVEQGEMPLHSYLWLHRNARLSAAEQRLLTDWAENLRRTIPVP